MIYVDARIHRLCLRLFAGAVDQRQNQKADFKGQAAVVVAAVAIRIGRMTVLRPVRFFD